MMKSNTLVILLLIVIFASLLAVPVTAAPVDSLTLAGLGTLTVSNILTASFDQLNGWESYSTPTGVEFGIENGVYRAYTPNPGYVWGLNSQEQTNVVAQVDVTPLTIYTDTGAGIMCRAAVSHNGDGYYFMINANGYYSIRIGRQGDVAPIIDWQPSKAIHTGIDQNTLRAVCVGNQLAMYINGKLVAQTVDDTYSSGFAGLSVAAGANSVDMAFDNMTLYTIQSPVFVGVSQKVSVTSSDTDEADEG